MDLTPLGTFDQILGSGIWPGVHPLRAPFWISGKNVVFSPVGPATLGGWSAPFSSAMVNWPRGFGQIKDSTGAQKLCYGTSDKLWLWDAVSETQVGSGFTGIDTATVTQDATQWSIESWGTWFLATNGIDTPQVWKASGNFVNLTGLNFTWAEIFVKRGPHVIALNTSNGQNWFEWCHEDDVEDWVPSASNTAGSLTIRELFGGIKAAVPWTDQILVAGKEQLFTIGYRGAPFYFGYRPLLNGVGAVSKHSVVVVGRKIYGLGPQGFWVSDGATFEFIDTPAIRKWFKSNVNTTQISKTCAVHDEVNRQIIWWFPTSSGEATEGVAFNYHTPSWSFLDFGRSAAAPRDAFSYMIGGTQSEIYFHNFGQDADGNAKETELITRPLVFPVGENQPYTATGIIKELEAIKAAWSGSGFRIFVRALFDTGETPAWTELTGGDGDLTPYFSDGVGGLYLQFRIFSDQVGDDWELQWLEVYGERVGT